MKILRLGDPHAKINNLMEMMKLILFVLETAQKHKVDRIEILGDLFHSHAVIRLEVVEFWTWALGLLSANYETVVLVGNHDLSGDYASNFSALNAFSLLNAQLKIIETPTVLGFIGYVPYIHNNDTFINIANELHAGGASVLVCHQTIQGSKYESGMYAPDGIPTGDWSKKFKHIISGHIHSQQDFDNIIYPGTARWDTISDVNQKKGIWIFEHNNDGTLLQTDFVSTEDVCVPIIEIIYSEGEQEPIIPPNSKVSLVLKGSSEWVRKEKEKFKDKVSIKTKFTDTKKKQSREIGLSFGDFLNKTFVTAKDKTKLLELCKEIGLV